MNAPSEPCPERELLLHGLADGELDAANALAVEEHLRGCAGCGGAYRDILQLKERLKTAGLGFQAPSSLRERILVQIAEEQNASDGVRPAPLRQRLRFGHAWGAFSAMALAASLVLFVSTWNQAPDIDSQLAAAHVRSLLASHLTDVASSDQHTVKPWFLGKVDFAPPVIDLAQKEFPLVGGRLDYIGGRVVPALVYKRHGHAINLFVWPEGSLQASTGTLGGYHIVSWNQGGFTYATVSDLNEKELLGFERDLKDALR
jgi:anti-sigma factor RsiW